MATWLCSGRCLSQRNHVGIWPSTADVGMLTCEDPPRAAERIEPGKAWQPEFWRGTYLLALLRQTFGRGPEQNLLPPSTLGIAYFKLQLDRGPKKRSAGLRPMVTIQVNFTVSLYMWHTEAVSRSTLSSVTDLASTLALEIRTVSGKLKRRLREHGERSDLTPSQASVLLRLEKDGSATVSGLARSEGMRPQSMSAVITVLQDAGLVAGAPDPDDGRQTLMCLTPKCLKLLKDGRAARQDWLTKRILHTLSVDEQKKLQAALELVKRLVED